MLPSTVVSFTDSTTGDTHKVTWEVLKRYLAAYKEEFGRTPTRDELFAYYIGV